MLMSIWVACAVLAITAEDMPPVARSATAQTAPPGCLSTNTARDAEWFARWETNILRAACNRYCDRETGEELGWLVSPFLEGFYYGYLATDDPQWIERLVDWTDAWIRRGVREPDGYVGWPKIGTGGAHSQDLYADSMLGEAMALRPVILMSKEIMQSPTLKARYGGKAEGYLRLAEQVFEKWDRRGAWRESGAGGVWVVPPFGIDTSTGGWTAGYARRHEDGFSHPANKQNMIACWLVALHLATGKPVYRARAEQWWRVMKSRLRLREGRYYVWNYWDPAGPWDFKPDGSPKHWIGVHPNGGYYALDVEGIVTAYSHGLVFTSEDLRRLIATNRDGMWNGQLVAAAFRRIDDGPPDPRWPKTPGVLWAALVPYDPTLRRIFEANHVPDSWAGLAATPRYLVLCRHPPAHLPDSPMP